MENLAAKVAAPVRRPDCYDRTALAAETVTDVLGETRPVDKIYADGGYNCPFCSGPVFPHDEERDGRRCGNPACTAGRYATLEWARKVTAVRAARKAEDDRRRAAHQFMHDYNERRRQRERQERHARLEEAAEQGYCPVCILGYHAKRVRHQDPANCPRPKPQVVVP